MAKKTVACDICGIEMDAKAAHFDIATERDLCDEHYNTTQLYDMRRERAELMEWLERTHLERIRVLDKNIAALLEKEGK